MRNIHHGKARYAASNERKNKVVEMATWYKQTIKYFPRHPPYLSWENNVSIYGSKYLADRFLPWSLRLPYAQQLLKSHVPSFLRSYVIVRHSYGLTTLLSSRPSVNTTQTYTIPCKFACGVPACKKALPSMALGAALRNKFTPRHQVTLGATLCSNARLRYRAAIPRCWHLQQHYTCS